MNGGVAEPERQVQADAGEDADNDAAQADARDEDSGKKSRQNGTVKRRTDFVDGLDHRLGNLTYIKRKKGDQPAPGNGGEFAKPQQLLLAEGPLFLNEVPQRDRRQGVQRRVQTGHGRGQKRRNQNAFHAHR